ncbi:auxin response factor 17-like [Typha angustifolia]|uniref:auxin response factor 17-like n=1 Tax=Typha angustifolia TaxID=59011 RepID=UPI003C2C1BAF
MHRALDPHVWKACAGPAARLPRIGSRVFYFPEGHAEQASSPPDFSSTGSGKAPFFICSIAGLLHLANPDTDEVFSKIFLHPILSAPPPSPPPLEDDDEDDAGGEGIVSFAKILTPSDANNGGGFSMPRFCADSVLPQLNFAADPPAQNISVRDVHGEWWEFRHIYRGTPRRHLLTTGWSRFVNAKKLIAGDSVVFIKNIAGELFIGVRRTARFSASNFAYNPSLNDGLVSGEGFSRKVRGRVPPATVVEAVREADLGHAFEVLYYPTVGTPDFVVAEEVVKAALRIEWAVGMRVKMPMATEDSARLTWFQGTVSGIAVREGGLWARSPWRMLQVIWDESEVLQNVRNVSPWQVELVCVIPQIQAPYPVTKKLKGPQSSEFLADGEGCTLVPMRGLGNSTMVNPFHPLLSFTTFPAGMQGARHEPISISNLSSFTSVDLNQIAPYSLYGIHMEEKLNNVSTKMNIGSTSHSESSSPLSQGSILDCVMEPFKTPACQQAKKVPAGCIQLFGVTIKVEKEPVDCETDKECQESNVGVLTHDFSPMCPIKQLLNKLDVQCQQFSSFEA